MAYLKNTNLCKVDLRGGHRLAGNPPAEVMYEWETGHVSGPLPQTSPACTSCAWRVAIRYDPRQEKGKLSHTWRMPDSSSQAGASISGFIKDWLFAVKKRRCPMETSCG
jgi:hypothetical protein